ncbi:glycoside hydrolase family 79 protein [Athelia psychrophila]|uniref:Glycoside hydrolase family 79 protein n=1 Tax=Athelia psychrophila TaxID=1759441 RepID=A0A167XAX0_9AGAM|nr:glycoside hydrolase family 79 protein [Fibularhizoctonia sp. CBS 109695]
MHPLSFFLLLALVHIAAAVTVYGQVPFRESTITSSAIPANNTAHATYDPKNLNPPSLPSLLSTQFSISLGVTNATQIGLSMPVPGSFYGFSVEISLIQVPFLNLMSLLKARGGGVQIRVGGNTQDTATMVSSLPNGTILAKGLINKGVNTQTPALQISPELIFMMNNISSLLGDALKWYLGVPMNDTSNPRLQIAEYGQKILGSNLLGLQIGNEPDLYGAHRLGGRSNNYTTKDYFTEFGQMMAAINRDAEIPVKNQIVGPSVTGGAKEWSTDEIFSTGYLQAYASNLGYIAVERYPDNNCAALYSNASTNYQALFQNYTTHASGLNLVSHFLDTAVVARTAGKPLLMFETNTASCGGFPGISDTYGAALWGIDYGLTMAAVGFSGALLHVSGSNVYYNPFTPPPTNQSAHRQWTISPIFYANLIMAEALGPSNTAQVVDLQANNFNNHTPAYAIYENGIPARVALFNYLTDPSGANTYTASIGISGGPGVGQVKVKYLTASSVAQKDNISWAGQNFGSVFESDGRLQGDVSVQTVPCSNNICQIRVPAPGFALVSFIDTAFTDIDSSPSAIPTYSTTAKGWHSKTMPTVNPTILATSNGHGGPYGKIARGSTSELSAGASRNAVVGPWLAAIGAAVFGAIVVGHRTII